MLLLLLLATLGLCQPAKTPNSREAYLVTNLPGMNKLPAQSLPLMFSGQLEVFPENNTNYFFWRYADNLERLPENTGRTMFWLNGGPGCSSMDGALLELGPFRVSGDKEVIYNEGSWHKLSDVIFVDQPAGTGFSYGDEYARELSDVGFDFVAFLDRYFEMFPEDRNNDIYLGGESFAGQYIPYIAREILARNEREDEAINLKALLIGNGWISPNEQSLSYLPYSQQAGIIDSSNPEWRNILQQHEKCQKIVDKIDATTDGLPHDYEIDSTTCEAILSMILMATSEPMGERGGSCVNMYDHTLRDTYPSCGMNWPSELENVTPFLRSEQVMGALNLKKTKKWRECSGKVHSHLQALNSVPAVRLLPDLLAKIPVVLFNGNRDIICNYMGTEGFIKKMEWNGATGFDSDAIDWVHDGETVGYVKSDRNLTFVNVFDSSHMVPYDRPNVSRALVDLVVGNYDKRDDKWVTYPIGERYERLKEETENKEGQNGEEGQNEGEENETEEGQNENEIGDENGQNEEGQNEQEEDNASSGSRLDRVILFLALIAGVVGVYVVYQAFTARTPSIIKSGTSGKKKNVKWADQLRRFQEDDPEFQRHKNQGFISKTLDRLKGVDKGRYAPVGYENIEMDARDDFIIESDGES